MYDLLIIGGSVGGYDRAQPEPVRVRDLRRRG